METKNELFDRLLAAYTSLGVDICNDCPGDRVYNPSWCAQCTFSEWEEYRSKLATVINHIKTGSGEQVSKDDILAIANIYSRMSEYICIYCMKANGNCVTCEHAVGGDVVEYWAMINALGAPGLPWVKR
jgi:hypothetical protein